MRLRRELRVRTFTAGALRTAISLGAVVVTAAFLPPLTQPAEASVGADSGPTVLGWQELTNPPPFNPGAMFLLTQYWQFVHGYTPLEAGVRMLPFATVMMITAPMSARIVERVGTKAVVTTGSKAATRLASDV